MTTPTFSFNALEDGNSAVIARSDSVARDLHLRYGLLRKQHGDRVWERPAISSFKRWVIQAWESCWSDTQYLSQVQETILYKSVIDSIGSLDLLSTASTARTCRHAGTLCRQYQVDIDHDEFLASPDTAAFQEWETEARNRMSVMGWATYGSIIEELIGFIETGELTLPAVIYQIGFIDFTPLQQRVFDAIADRGTRLARVPAEKPASRQIKLRHHDPVTQMRETTIWIQSQLHPYINSPHEAPRIAVLVSDINQYREQLEEVFFDILAPDFRLPFSGDRHLPWRFSVGQPLELFPLIHAAYGLLEITLYDNDIDLVTRVLNNPRLGDSHELMERSRLDLAIRQLSFKHIDLAQLVRIADDSGVCDAPLFARRLNQLKTLLDSAPSRALPSEWAQSFKARLELMGWPGDRSLSSEEYQLRSSWNECLAGFASMDRQLGEITPGRALAWFREMLHARSFQPRLQYQPPVTVLELRDVPGLRFDKAVVLDLGATTLPEPVDPNPFIPLSMQQAAGIPLASPQAALQYAEHLFEYVSAVADELLLCCPLHDRHGSPLAPSPLVEGWPVEAPPPASFTRLSDRILAQGLQTRLPDTDPAPPVESVQDEHLKGGVKIIQHFAEMPFVALARSRLALYPFPLPVEGLDKATQGTLVHAVLDQFWRQTRTSEQLDTLEPDQLVSQVRQCIDKTLSDTGLLAPWRYGQHVVEMETRRIQEIVVEWLHHEQGREDPFEVIHTELEVEAELQGLPLKMRIDRIDRITTAAGPKFLIVDYKTGDSVKPSGWNVEKLVEPQLPLYATCASLPDDIPQVDGIAFGHVTVGYHEFHLRTNWTGHLVPTTGKNNNIVPEDWAYQLQEWREALDQMASQFMAGRADADSNALITGYLYQDLIPLVHAEV